MINVRRSMQIIGGAAAVTLPVIFWYNAPSQKSAHSFPVRAPIEAPLERRVEETKANRFLYTFPDSFPNARVDKYETPGAQHLIVHVRQHHVPSDYILKIEETEKWVNENREEGPRRKEKIDWLPGARRSLKEETRRAEEVQIQIYSTLESIRGLSIAQLYQEGMEEAYLAKPDEIIADIVSIAKRLEKQGCETQRIRANDYIALGAGLQLWKEGKLELLAAEPSGTTETAIRVFRKSSLNAFTQYIEEEAETREDYFLKQATSSKEAVSVILLGGSHSLGGPESCVGYDSEGRFSKKDNIAEWNRQHPEEKISLCEITVNAYRNANDKGLLLLR